MSGKDGGRAGKHSEVWCIREVGGGWGGLQEHLGVADDLEKHWMLGQDTDGVLGGHSTQTLPDMP